MDGCRMNTSFKCSSCSVRPSKNLFQVKQSITEALQLVLLSPFTFSTKTLCCCFKYVFSFCFSVSSKTSPAFLLLILFSEIFLLLMTILLNRVSFRRSRARERKKTIARRMHLYFLFNLVDIFCHTFDIHFRQNPLFPGQGDAAPPRQPEAPPWTPPPPAATMRARWRRRSFKSQ